MKRPVNEQNICVWKTHHRCKKAPVTKDETENDKGADSPEEEVNPSEEQMKKG